MEKNERVRNLSTCQNQGPNAVNHYPIQSTDEKENIDETYDVRQLDIQDDETPCTYIRSGQRNDTTHWTISRGYHDTAVLHPRDEHVQSPRAAIGLPIRINYRRSSEPDRIKSPELLHNLHFVGSRSGSLETFRGTPDPMHSNGVLVPTGDSMYGRRQTASPPRTTVSYCPIRAVLKMAKYRCRTNRK